MAAFDPARQNRVAFIRGRGKRDLDDLLLPLAEVVDSLAPCDVGTYRSQMLIALDELLPGGSRSTKTLNNWTTEIVDKLFGLIIQRGETIWASGRTSRLVDSRDQIGFFRELVYRFQYPFFGGKPQSWDDQEHLSLRPGVFCVQVLAEAEQQDAILTTDELKYYVLNASDVQRGSVGPTEVVERILSDRSSGRPPGFPVPSGSHASQHLNEFIGFLELAGLARIEDSEDGTNFVHLVQSSPDTLSVFLVDDPTRVEFSRAAGEDASLTSVRWSEFWTSISPDAEAAFYTETARTNLLASEGGPSDGTTTTVGAYGDADPPLDVGTIGELLVMEFESERLSRIHPTLTRHLKNRSAERNVGYDIQSVRGDFADDPGAQEQYISIEVKTRRRATLVTSLPRERITMTSNEWNQARSVRDAYFVYHVFITAEGNQIFITQNPAEAEQDGRLRVVPSEYALYFDLPTAQRFDL